MPSTEVRPYADLPTEERTLPQTNWVTHGSGEGWTDIKDERYGTIQHIRIIGEDGKAYDKINLEWTPGAFVVVFRFNPEKDNRVEYLLPMEKRLLLKDEDGEQGNLSIRNIPQGLIKVWKNESAEQAAMRETIEETGLTPTDLRFMNDLFPDAANSSTPMPFFLAEVAYEPSRPFAQELGPDEEIEVGENDWFGIEEIHELRLQCAKTLAGIMLSTGFLATWENEPATKPY